MNALAMLDESTEAILLASRILGANQGPLVVTSCEDYAGKTTLCRILARIAMERLKRPVVYVDLNLRHPAPPEAFSGLGFREGFTLRVPGEDFGTLPGWAKRERIAALLEPCGEDCLVLVDTSPLGVFNRNNIHPVHLAEWSREFVLVVAQESSRNTSVREARALLSDHGIRILGAVLNRHEIPEGFDPASVTRWKLVASALAGARRSMPVVRRRTRTVLHGLRVLWRLERPMVRRQFNRILDLWPLRPLLGWMRRRSPERVSRLRGRLSRLRSVMDRLLGTGEDWWTRN